MFSSLASSFPLFFHHVFEPRKFIPALFSLLTIITPIHLKRTLLRILIILPLLRLIFNPIVMIHSIVQLLIIVHLVLLIDFAYSLAKFNDTVWEEQFFNDAVKR